VGLIVDKDSVDSIPAGTAGPVGIVLDKTPFYGESGGQVGDIGRLTGNGTDVTITDCQKHNQTLFVLEGRLAAGSLAIGGIVNAEVDNTRRSAIRRSHSATHILHHALHQTIGDKATQRGSRVEDDALRFDFAHKQAMTPEEVRQVEDIVNTQIASGSNVDTELLAIDEARSRGAMALFGEKYPDEVRVVTMGDFSVELCGGTHVTNTGQIGLCRIVSEEPVAKGVRRITAVTGRRALEKGREADELLLHLQRLLKANQSADLPARVEALQEQLKDLKEQLADLSSASVSEGLDALVADAEEIDSVKIVAQQLKNATRESLRDYADQLRDKHSPIAVILGAEIDGKVALIAAVSKPLVKAKGLNAGQAVKAAAQTAGGGGGGRPDIAEAGAKQLDKIADAIAAGATTYKEQLA
jgi:alanyl-tRNA synthetase